MNTGIGIILKALSGDASFAAVAQQSGKLIKYINIVDWDDWGATNRLVIEFENGKVLEVYDGGQSCCERRYMHTEDDLSYYVGSTFLGAKVQDGPTKPDKYGDPTDSQFLIVETSLGAFTIVNYNEHNGYYGGFWLSAKLSDADE